MTLKIITSVAAGLIAIGTYHIAGLFLSQKTGVFRVSQTGVTKFYQTSVFKIPSPARDLLVSVGIGLFAGLLMWFSPTTVLICAGILVLVAQYLANDHVLAPLPFAAYTGNVLLKGGYMAANIIYTVTLAAVLLDYTILTFGGSPTLATSPAGKALIKVCIGCLCLSFVLRNVHIGYLQALPIKAQWENRNRHADANS